MDAGALFSAGRVLRGVALVAALLLGLVVVLAVAFGSFGLLLFVLLG